MFSVYENTSSSSTNYQYTLEFINNQGREIVLKTDKHYTQNHTDHNWAFEVKNVITFFWRSQTNNMSYTLHTLGTQKLLHYWFYHIVYPLYLTLENKYFFLHTGAVNINNNAVAFMADSYGGKSTLTDYFLKKEHRLITDDKLATYHEDDKFYAVSSYPYHRPFRENETVGYFVENFETEVLALQSIYVLDKVDALGEVEISELRGIEKFKHLHTSSEIGFLFEFSKKVEYLSKLANGVLVYQISVPWDLERLEEVYSKILQHQKTLQDG